MRIIRIPLPLIEPKIPDRTLPPPFIDRSRFVSTMIPVARSILPRSGWYPASSPPRITKKAVSPFSGIDLPMAIAPSSKTTCERDETAVAYGTTPKGTLLRCRASPDLSNQNCTRGFCRREAASALSTQNRSPLLLTPPGAVYAPALSGRFNAALHCAATLVTITRAASAACLRLMRDPSSVGA